MDGSISKRHVRTAERLVGISTDGASMNSKWDTRLFDHRQTCVTDLNRVQNLSVHCRIQDPRICNTILNWCLGRNAGIAESRRIKRGPNLGKQCVDINRNGSNSASPQEERFRTHFGTSLWKRLGTTALHSSIGLQHEISLETATSFNFPSTVMLRKRCFVWNVVATPCTKYPKTAMPQIGHVYVA